LVWFRFYKPKTESNQIQTEKNWKKTEPTEKTKPNRFEPFFVLKNQTEPKPVGLNRFQVFFKKISVWLLFFDKNRTELKIIILSKEIYFIS
jgi:hypothetical protein